MRGTFTRGRLVAMGFSRNSVAEAIRQQFFTVGYGETLRRTNKPALTEISMGGAPAAPGDEPVKVFGKGGTSDIGEVVDELTYRSYVANRQNAPDISPERWKAVYGPSVDAMEEKYQASLNEPPAAPPVPPVHEDVEFRPGEIVRVIRDGKVVSAQFVKAEGGRIHVLVDGQENTEDVDAKDVGKADDTPHNNGRPPVSPSAPEGDEVGGIYEGVTNLSESMVENVFSSMRGEITRLLDRAKNVCRIPTRRDAALIMTDVLKYHYIQQSREPISFAPQIPKSPAPPEK